MVDETDVELVARARGGDLDAYGVLVRRYHSRVAGLCRTMLDDPGDADDAAQDAFLKAHRGLRNFRGDARFSTWLYRVTTNQCLNVRRSRARRRTVSLDALVEAEGDAAARLFSDAGRPGRAAAPEEGVLARRLLDALPQGYREALVLRETQGFTYAEIGAALGLTLDAVKARLRRARAALHARFSGETAAEPAAGAGGGDEA